MGDNNNVPASGHSSLSGHLLQGSGATGATGMDVLMSAIEYKRRSMTMDPIDPKLIDSRAMLYGGYPLMANMHNQGASSSPHHVDSRRPEPEGQNVPRMQTSQPSMLYPTHMPFPASGVVSGSANPYFGLNPTMLMPFMSSMLQTRPTSSGAAPHGSVPQSAVSAWAAAVSERAEEQAARDRDSTTQMWKCTFCGAICSDTVELHNHMQKHLELPVSHMLPRFPPRSQDRDHSRMQEGGHGSRDSRRPNLASSHEPSSDSTSIPYTSGVPFYPQPGMGLPPDKLGSVHDPSSSSNLRYPTPGALNPYLGYQSLLAANAGALLPSMLPSAWNQALGGLGYPYYPGGLLPRLPFLSQMPQTSMHVPASNQSTSPAQSIPQEPLTTPKTNARLDPARPLSGGYLPIKETLQKRLSAPVMVSGSPRVPGRPDQLLTKGGSNYPSFPHRTHLPSQLIAPTPDSSKSVKPGFAKGRIDHKSIEQHISKLISHNEKILTNPTLDRVKPRRVFRRSSLDPSSLSTNPPHNTLTATYSAPRVLDQEYHKSLLDDKPVERPNFLTVPSRLTEPHPPATDGSHGDKPFVTVIPDPRRDPNVHRLTTNAEIREQLARKVSGSYSSSPGSERVSMHAKTVTQDMYQQTAMRRRQLGQHLPAAESYEERRDMLTFHCEDCGVQFAKQENYEAHRRSYCLKRSPPGNSIIRESVIQHTGAPDPSDPQTLPKPLIPQVCVTPPPGSMAHDQYWPNAGPPKTFLTAEQAEYLANPMRHFRKDLQRTRSADAAILPSRLAGNGSAGSPVTAVPATSKSSSKPPSPVESETDPKSSSSLSVTSHFGVTKSSIPTDKLPPKKKQLQLMRSNSSNHSYTDTSKSPSRTTPVSISPQNSPTSHGSKTPEISPVVPEAPLITPESRASPLIMITPPSATHATSRASLPPWISLDRDDPPDSSQAPSPIMLAPAPTLYLTQDSVLTTTSAVALQRAPPSMTTTARSPTRSPTSPRSPRSPTRRSSPGRSPTRSPTRSPNLESTIPRSNYKLLLHQLSVRNMQDMDYLSEAYHNSKDKNLKRNIASLLQSSSGTPSSYLGSSLAKRGRAFSPEHVGVKLEELYPGKASLARRLSPNVDAASRLSGKYDAGGLSPRAPLSQSRSKPYEDNLNPYPSVSVTRSHSAGYSSDVNNNIKQYLQNKSRNQQAAMESSAQPSKGHKPLRRLNANARYVLKSPTKETSQAQAETSVSRLPVTVASGSESWKRTVGKTLSASRECTERLKESLALKRASSYNPESSLEYQNKRRKLIPIPQKATQTSVGAALPASLIAPHISEKEKKPEPQKADSAEAVRVSSLLYPHLAPKLSFEPHATFCSLLSPQPMYVELERSTLSMYSQWAVSEPLMLPEGLTVMDLLKNTRILKGLSPYVSYNSLFTPASPKEISLSVTDTKEYEASAKTAKEKGSSSDTSSQPLKSGGEKEPEKTTKIGDEKKVEGWLWSRMDESMMLSSKLCYTSCHSKNVYKPNEKKPVQTGTDNSTRRTEVETDKGQLRKTLPPKIQPPKVVIHPPSPTNSDSLDDTSTTPDSKNDEIAALEFSDSSDDTLPDRLSPTDHFLHKEKGALSIPVDTPPSEMPNRHAAHRSAIPRTSPAPSGGTNSAPKNIQVTHAEGDGGPTTVTKPAQNCSSDTKNVDICENSDPMQPSVTDIIGQGCPAAAHTNGPISPSATAMGNESPNHRAASDVDVEVRTTDGFKGESSKDRSNSMEEGVKGQSSGSENGDSSRKKNKKVRKSRRERNASSPRLQRRMNQQFPDSPPGHALEDPSLAVHPTGACRGLSDDPSRTCALCSMKAEGSSTKCWSDARSSSNTSDDSSEAKSEIVSNCEQSATPLKEKKACKHQNPASQEAPPSSTRPHTPTSARAKTPTSTNSKPQVPLTVSVPMRNRDRSSTKSAKQPLAPGILDKARGKGTTQHWVTTSDLQSAQPPADAPKSEEKKCEKHEVSERAETPKITEYDKTFQSEYYSTMPPNKNPVLELNLQKNSEQPLTTSTPTTGGQQALAAVVSGVMRSAAIQSKKKTKNAKLGMNELLSHSRPLIPTSELNGSAVASHARLSEKLKEGQNGPNEDKEEPDSLGSLVAMTVGLATPHAQPKQLPLKLGKSHLSLSLRESELFLNKANDTKTVTPQATLAEYAATKITQAIEENSGEEESPEKDCDAPTYGHPSPPSGNSSLEEQGLQEGDDGQQSDDAKDDSMHDGDGESANPRPHKCAECKVAFRIAGHLAKHLRSKGHIIAMQKKTLNRLKQQQKLSSASQDTMATGGQGVNSSASMNTATNTELAQQQAIYSQLEAGKCSNQEELLNQLVEGAETLARAQVRALFEGNDEYTEIVTSGANTESAMEGGVSDVGEDGEGFMSMSALSTAGGLDPRPFKCIACKVAFRFQGHLDRHFRSNMHLLAVGHFERDKVVLQTYGPTNMGAIDPIVGDDADGDMDEPHADPDLPQMSESPQTGAVTSPPISDPAFSNDSAVTSGTISNPVFVHAENSHRSEENSAVAMDIDNQQNLDKMHNGDISMEEYSPASQPRPLDDQRTTPTPSVPEMAENSPKFTRRNGPSENIPKLDSNNNMDVDLCPDSLEKLPITHTSNSEHSDSSVEVPIKPNPTSNSVNGPINGLCSVPSECVKSSLFPIGADAKNAPPTNNDFKTLKQRLSPAIQSNAKPLFEAPPTLPEGPIKANSPVNRQQQLTC